MAETILFIFEGERTEVKFFEKLYRNYFSEDTNINIYSTYNTNIYHLWDELSTDDDLDIVELVREKSQQNKANLEGIRRNQIAQVYLFFDHDAHDPDASANTINSMLSLYSEETNHGKLYISYPMTEALKDFRQDVQYQNLTHPINRNKNYKQIVGEKTNYQDIRKIQKNTWDFIVSENLKKGNFLVNNNHSIIPYKDIHQLSQKNIFDTQLIKYIEPTNHVSVLSAFPFFLIEYFGEKFYSILGLKDS